MHGGNLRCLSISSNSITGIAVKSYTVLVLTLKFNSQVLSKSQKYKHEKNQDFRTRCKINFSMLACLMSSCPCSALNRGKSRAVGQRGIVEGGRVCWNLLQRINIMVMLTLTTKMAKVMLVVEEVTNDGNDIYSH